MDEAHSYDDIDGLLNDTFRDIAQDERAYEGPNEDAQNIYNLCGSPDVQTSNLFPNRGCPLGGKKGEPTFLDNKSRHQARGYILNNCDEVLEYISMSDEAESDVPQSYINEPYDHSMGLSIPEDNGEVDLVRSDIPATIIKVHPREFVVEDPEQESEDEDQMNQGAALKKKVLNSNNGSSPIKNEKLDNERKNLVMKGKNSNQAPPYKRKNCMSVTSNASERQPMQRSIQFEESIEMQKRSKLPIHKSVTQLLSRKEVNTSHMTERIQGEEENQLDIEELQNYKTAKKKSLVPAMSLNHFLERIGINVGEEEPYIQPGDDVRSMPSPCINENNIEVADGVALEEVDECVRDKDMDINCSEYEREEVTFDHGQAVGPIGKRVSDLSNFLGTIARYSRFITLLYIGWLAVPKDTKLRMWEYVNRATKENNEEPSKVEMFIATCTKNGKQVDPITEVVIICDNNFFKKDEEIIKIKQKHVDEINSFKEEVKELKEEVVELRKLEGMKEEVQELQQLRHLMKLLVKNNPGLNLEDTEGFIGSNQPSPVDSSSARATRGQNLPRSSGSTHGPTLEKETYGNAIGNGGRKLS
ncbi:hypothetical protein H5410_041176 [Solanum commersonii]|uniref:Uncharacterized protein n=1 Tax=Solanum commersonii TaxID=4109 RepID=A0A9J5XUQ1_SOLCO|nr:hypothetical protein H5410_041176 [Solanum commersonii]